MMASTMITRRTAIKGACSIGALAALGWTADAIAGKDDLLRPPGGQDEDRFVGSCIKCGRCLSICPRTCLEPAALSHGIVNARTPYLDFKAGFCDFCGVCAEVCPTGALKFDEGTKAVLGIAIVDAEHCVSCEQCVPACAYEALTWSDDRNLPVVDEARCNGCGACEHACPSASLSYFHGDGNRAIHVTTRKALQ